MGNKHLIAKDTVLILGAGASVPYGYPTAKELREFVVTSFINEYSQYLRQKSKPESEVINASQKFSHLIQTFRQSSNKSFDLFLSRNRKKYYTDGKFILAWSILYFEALSKFNEDIDRPDTDWYTYIFNEMTDKMTKSSDLEKFTKNKLKLLSFNYDRSFEEFIFQSLFFSFSGDNEDVMKAASWIKVLHIYGKILELQWENPSIGEKYKTNNILDLTTKAKDNIEIIYDERISKSEEIKKIIMEAERIFFLGFGYSLENIEALGLRNILTQSQWVYGTALGFTATEIINIKKLLRSLNPILPDHHINLENLDCVGLLRKYL